MYISLVCIV